MKIPALAALSVASFCALASSQTCSLLEDINQLNGQSSSSPRGNVENLIPIGKVSYPQLGGYWYFSAYTKATGRELFRTDGTQQGTSLVADLNPGTGNSTIDQMVVEGGKLWFVVENDLANSGLYVTDGTPGGTSKLTVGLPQIHWPTGMGGKLYFGSVAHAASGSELWVSDGTPAGTHLLIDLNPGANDSDILKISRNASGDRLLFWANDGVTGSELWTSDGTVAGTTQVLDINPGTASSTAYVMTPLNGKDYFITKDGTHGHELWVTDGTSAGTSLLVDINGTSASTGIRLDDSASMGGELYFAAQGPNGEDLWKTDGTALGTVPVADIDPLGNADPKDVIALGGRIFFSANVNASSGRELWTSDGTAAGTQLVMDIFPGSNDGLAFSGNGVSVLGNKLLFTADDGVNGRELWQTDGTTTSLLLDALPGPNGGYPAWFTPLTPTSTFFSVNDGLHGTELWITDGTATGTSFLFDIDGDATDGSAPDDLFAVGGDYFLFTADDGLSGRELYRWDPANGVALLKDIWPGAQGSDCRAFYSAFVAGGWLTFFGADDGVHGSELWVTDGTTAGTQLLKDINPNGPGYSSMIGKQTESMIFFHQVHQRVYFAGDDGVNGTELWSTDGTPAGTTLFKELATGSDFGGTPYSSGPAHFTALGDLLIFSASTFLTGNELFVSDGTPAGTSLLFEFISGENSGKPTSLTTFGDKVVFFAEYPGYGRELFVTDGTVAGTTLIRDINQGTFSSDPENGKSSTEFVLYNGYMYFSAESDQGRELWRTDLTWPGTTLFASMNPGPNHSAPRELTVAGDGFLYFMAYEGGSYGNQIFKTDGTPGSTARVPFRMYPPGTLGSLVNLTAVNNGIYFTSLDDQGVQIQFTGGASSGVTTICTVTLEVTSDDSILCAGDMFFMARDAVLGTELFHLSPAGAYVQDLGMSASGIALSSTDPIVGANLTVTIEDPLAPGVGFLLMSGHLGTPLPYPSTPPSVLWVSPTSFTILGTVTTPSWSTTLPIPSGAALIGLELNLQSWQLPGGVFPATTSNGLQLVLGS